MAEKPSWIEEAWENLLEKIWDAREEGTESVEYTKEHLEPILSKYTKSGQGEIRIFHSGHTKRNALKRRGLIKVPLSRGSWKLIKSPEYIIFPEPAEEINFHPINPLTEGMRAGIAETLSTSINPGETTLLAIANHIGLVANFYDLQGKGTMFTGGRQKAGVVLVYGDAEIDMSRAQIEIDGGFEWSESAVIVEMKSSFKQSDFDSNQALIPLLKWQKLLSNKKVYSLILLGQTNANGIEYRAYDFVPEKNSLGMKMTKCKKYLVKI